MSNRTVRISDAIGICAHIQGDGPPLLMIHGACVDSSFFEECARLLAHHFTVVTYDRRGYGESDGDIDSDCSIECQAVDAARVMEEVAPDDSWHIVASSAGCLIALILNEWYPDAICSTLLHEPAIIDCLPRESSYIHRITDAMAEITSDSYLFPLWELLSLENLSDERGPALSPAELAFRDRNYRQFALGEATEIYEMHFNYDVLAKRSIAVGVGERSLETYHATCCPELCKRIGASLLYFPGGHNCARDLPMEFARMVLGHFLLGTELSSLNHC